MADIDALLGNTGAAASRPSPTRKKKATGERPLHMVEPESDVAAPDPAEERARAQAHDAEVKAAADAYEALLPAIKAARPQPPTYEEQTQLTGEDWVIDAWKQALFGGDHAAFGLDSRFTADVYARGDAVIVDVTVPESLAGEGRAAVAETMVAEASRRQNLGLYRAEPAEDRRKFFLIRDGAIDVSSGWNSQPKTAGFYRGGDYRRSIWDLVGLVQKAPTTGQLQYPQPEFRSGDRGGEAVLTLPPGMLPRDAIAAQDALRAALAQPDLTIGAGDGLRPVIHLNTKAVERALPNVAALVPTAFTRARTEVEMYAAAKDFTLPIGVRTDPETGAAVLLTANLDVTPHAACFGPTGSGKTVWLSICVRAAAIQGCADIILWDAKEGSDLRELAFDRSVPGIVHYASGDAANGAMLHRCILFMRDEFDRRKAIARKLAYRGIKYRPRPLLVVMDELPAWIRDQKAMKGDAAKAAQLSEARLDYMGSQARELRIFFLVAGQTAYVEGYPGSIRGNTRTLIQLGEPETVNVNALFPGREKEARDLANTITPDDRGVGVVMDPEKRNPILFRGFFNAPGSPEAARFDAALREAPRKRRWSYKLPRGSEPGSDGSWQQWHPLSEPSSDSLVAQYLDDESFRPYPDRVCDDPTDSSYDPGAAPAPARHLR